MIQRGDIYDGVLTMRGLINAVVEAQEAMLHEAVIRKERGL